MTVADKKKRINRRKKVFCIDPFSRKRIDRWDGGNLEPVPSIRSHIRNNYSKPAPRYKIHRQMGREKWSRLSPCSHRIDPSCDFEREMPAAFRLPEGPPTPGPPVAEMLAINGAQNNGLRPKKGLFPTQKKMAPVRPNRPNRIAQLECASASPDHFF